MAKARKSKKQQKPDMSHETGFFAMPTYSGDGIKVTLRADNKSVKEKIIADKVQANEKEGLLEIAKVISYCINAGIDQETLLKMILEMFGFTKDYDISSMGKYESCGISVLQPLLVKYLFRSRDDDGIVEIRPRYKTKLLGGSTDGNSSNNGVSKDRTA